MNVGELGLLPFGEGIRLTVIVLEFGNKQLQGAFYVASPSISFSNRGNEKDPRHYDTQTHSNKCTPEKQTSSK